MSTKITWNEENVAALIAFVGEVSPVSQELVASAAEELGTTPRSIGAKLRNLGVEVEKVTAKASAWSVDAEAALKELVLGNSGSFTYKEIAAQFEGGKFSHQQVQGKLLSMELFSHVRKADKKVAPRTYTPEQEVVFIKMANEGATMEALAEEFGKTKASVRGKALSLLRAESISAMPKQAESSAKAKVDPIKDIDVANMTVAAIAEASGKSERGIKSILSRRGIDCSDYKGAAKRAKLDSAD